MDDFSYKLGSAFGVVLSYAYILLPVVLLFFVIKGFRSLLRELRENDENQANANLQVKYDDISTDSSDTFNDICTLEDNSNSEENNNG